MAVNYQLPTWSAKDEINWLIELATQGFTPKGPNPAAYINARRLILEGKRLYDPNVKVQEIRSFLLQYPDPKTLNREVVDLVGV